MNYFLYKIHCEANSIVFLSICAAQKYLSYYNIYQFFANNSQLFPENICAHTHPNQFRISNINKLSKFTRARSWVIVYFHRLWKYISEYWDRSEKLEALLDAQILDIFNGVRSKYDGELGIVIFQENLRFMFFYIHLIRRKMPEVKSKGNNP